jgi:hypothetical protein
MQENRWLLVAMLAAVPLFGSDNAFAQGLAPGQGSEPAARQAGPPRPSYDHAQKAAAREPVQHYEQRSEGDGISLRYVPILRNVLPGKAAAWPVQLGWQPARSRPPAGCQVAPSLRLWPCGS